MENKIHCPSCGKILDAKRYFHKAGGENFMFECDCTWRETIFARRWNGLWVSIYFIDPQRFEDVWKSNTEPQTV